MKGFHRLALLLLLWVTACGSNVPPASSPPPASPAEPAPAGEAAPPAPEVDGTRPLPLAAWRAIKEKGAEAIRIQDLDQRIAACRAFVAEHGEHQQAGPVLEALAEALVDRGGFDPGELAQVVERRAAADEDSETGPIELVRKYHVKHKLALDSGLGLLVLSRQRIARERDKLPLETSEQQREYLAAYLDYAEVRAEVMAGRLQLVHDRPAPAAEALRRAGELAQRVTRGTLVRAGSGRELRTLPAGVLDELHVLGAAAHLRLGDRKAAGEALRQAVGFVADVDLRALFETTRDQLGQRPRDAALVTVDPQPAQEFTLKDLDGKQVRLADYRGKVVLAAFWATWCGPCKRELPELVKFARANRARGVELLAISIDDFADRPKIRPFLKESNLDLKVLLEQPEQLTTYNYRAIPALYIIDRQGRIAHARTGYDADLQEKLARDFQTLVEGKGSAGRPVFTVEVAPAGFAVRWKRPVTGDVSALAVAGPLGKRPGEIAVVGRSGLTRWSPAGEQLGTRPLAGWTRGLRAADLDGDGGREWIVSGWSDIKVLDGEGELYWEHRGDSGLAVAGIRDLDGDGFQEIVTADERRVVTLKANGRPYWKSQPFASLKAATLDPTNGLVIQVGAELRALSARGVPGARLAAVPEGRTLAARMRLADGSAADLLRGRWDPEPIVDQDIDGDGRADVVLPDSQGVIAYDADGRLLLRIRSDDVGLTTAVGDVDGRPGAELIVFAEHYGLLLLGRP